MKTQELCPQALLDDEYYPESLDLDQLTFDQLVAGELEICTLPDLSKAEKNTRLQILKLLAYFRNTLPQHTLLDVYKAVILKVEKGLFSWSPLLVSKVEKMLDRAVGRSKVQKGGMEKIKSKEEISGSRETIDKKEVGLLTSQGDRVVYCLEYNKGKCNKGQTHEGKFAGKECIKHHICKACLTIDKEKRNHQEGDLSCPNKNK